MTRWVALLRGVNVGGGNRLAMADLRATVASLGHTNVATYIQSGNVVFDADLDDEPLLVATLSDALSMRHRLAVPVVARTRQQLIEVAGRHPDAGGSIAAKFLHVQFLSAEPDLSRTAALDPVRYLPDRWSVIGREIYTTYPNGSGRSKLTGDVLERAFHVTATARNLNTVEALVALC